MQISPGLIGLAVLAVLLIWVATSFNQLVAQRARVRNAWAEIDVQLTRRHDLIPNLVESVRGYMQHESSTLNSVTQARAQAMAVGGNLQQRAVAESALTQAVGKLLAIAENYPQLRAVESFTSLQNSLSEIEDNVQNARRYYNAVVRDLNTKIQQFPSNIFANMLGFKPREFFEVTAPAEREAPKVSFSTPSA